FVKDEKGKRRPVPGSTWTFQFGVRVNGKRHNVSKGGFRTRKECEQALAAALAEHERGTHVDASKTLFRDYLQREWLPVVETSKKPSTYATYRHFVERRIIP